MHIKTVLIVFLFLVGFSASANAKTWHTYQSDNFIVYSDDDPEKVEELVKDLEFFREFLQAFTGVAATTGTKPLEIFAYRNHRSLYDDTNFSAAILGIFQPNLHGTVALANIQKESETVLAGGRQVLFHEYVHYFLSQFTDLRYPRWYDEGIADYLSTFERDGNKVRVGGVLRNRRLTLRARSWFSLDVLLTSIDTIEVPDHLRGGIFTFYAQSWLFVHYLLSTPERQDQLNRYLEAINQGVPDMAAAEGVFGESLRQLNRDLADYWKEMRAEDVDFDFQVMNINPGVTVKRLGEVDELFLRARAKTYGLPKRIKLSQVRRDVKKILRLNPDHVDAKLLLAENYLLHGKEKNKNEARKTIVDILAADPNNARARAVHGLALYLDGFEDDAPNRGTVLTAARESLKFAAEANSGDAFTIYHQAAVELAHPNPDYALGLAAVERGLALYPQLVPIEFQHAFLLEGAGRKAEAGAKFQSLANMARGQFLRDYARNCLEQIEFQAEEFSCQFEDLEDLGP